MIAEPTTIPIKKQRKRMVQPFLAGHCSLSLPSDNNGEGKSHE